MRIRSWSFTVFCRMVSAWRRMGSSCPVRPMICWQGPEIMVSGTVSSWVMLAKKRIFDS